jgi:hypothetical protein
MSEHDDDEWDVAAFRAACEEAVAFAGSMLDGTLPPPSPEVLALAKRAVESCEARKNEDVNAWAKRLTENVCAMGD